MVTYNQIYNLRYASSNLKSRVVVAIAKAALDVLNEDTATTNHTARAAWAHLALEDTPRMAERMLWGVLANATIQTTGEASADADIQFVINGLVNAYAAED